MKKENEGDDDEENWEMVRVEKEEETPGFSSFSRKKVTSLARKFPIFKRWRKRKAMNFLSNGSLTFFQLFTLRNKRSRK